jgi:hypothetical protein
MVVPIYRESGPASRRPPAYVHLRDAVAVHVDARARAAEPVHVAALDHDFAGPDPALEAPAGFFSARLAERRGAHVLKADPLAMTAQVPAVDRHAALARAGSETH